MAIYFRAADRREVPAREALDARGILKHGYGQRVPAVLRDAAPRFAWDAHRASLTDGRIGGVEGNRPGFRMFTDDDAGRQAVADARASYIRDLENAWRNPPPTGRSRCPECDGSGVVHGKVCQGCGGDGWVDDDEDNEDDNGEKTAASDRRMRDVQAVSAAHQQNMTRIYDQIAVDVSQQWRRDK